MEGSPAASMDGSTAVRDVTGVITLLADSSCATMPCIEGRL
jgi:hypothetical protein